MGDEITGREMLKNGYVSSAKKDIATLNFENFEADLFTCRLLALGEGEWLPPLSESLVGAVTPSLGGCTAGMLPA